MTFDFFGHLSNLKHLAISTGIADGDWASLIRLPNLATLALASTAVAANHDGLDCETFVALKELSMYNGSLCLTPITWLLERAPALTKIHFIGVRVQPGTPDPFLERLSERVNVICPRLEYLEVSSGPMVRAGPVVRIVKSRLQASLNEDEQGRSLDRRNIASTESGYNDEQGSIRPIQTLILDDCPNMDPEVLPWLRAHVPVVSCKAPNAFRPKRTRPVEFSAPRVTVI